ncbi:DUF1840 domain-containing protein [Oxalobacteraceae bacterium R-40]|uniref:DUF1840 domain-containing protein n=1 Tax=Keguizhuia sedimenti TaxID=3064264 RepID=A0ABU1BK43_9BURK|nr:DUF1840 domain-containing protein [Oxalobacteraceae bacterium R-40]
MLVKFKSKAAADVVMYEEHAKLILDLLGKDTKQGIITAEQAGRAIAAIETEIERLNRLAAEEAKQNGIEQDDAYDDLEQTGQAPVVKFSTRAYPLLEMLRAADKNKQPVVWGV